MMFSSLFEGTPPEPLPDFSSAFDAVHWGCAHGMTPAPDGAMLIKYADGRGMMFRAKCPDGKTRQIPCSAQQQDFVGRLLGFLSRKTAQCPPGMSADIELMERYARITRRMLADLGPLPWDFDADAFGLAAGPWWRKVRDVPAWADEFTEAAKGRFEKLAAAVPPDYAARVCGILAMKGGEFSALVRVHYWILRGMLPADFSDLDLVRLARVNGIPLTPRGEELLAGAAGGNSQSAGTPSKQSGHLAADVGAASWQELEFRVLAGGLNFRKEGTNGRFIHRTWGALGLKGRLVVCALLIEIAKHGGTFPKDHEADKRRNRVIILNKAFLTAFGLSGNPFRNDRRLGTQTVVGSISWGGKP